MSPDSEKPPALKVALGMAASPARGRELESLSALQSPGKPAAAAGPDLLPLLVPGHPSCNIPEIEKRKPRNLGTSIRGAQGPTSGSPKSKESSQSPAGPSVPSLVLFLYGQHTSLSGGSSVGLRQPESTVHSLFWGSGTGSGHAINQAIFKDAESRTLKSTSPRLRGE